MSYIVFARKWRPQTFDEIVGQEHITTTLKNAIQQDRVAHAYLFCGPRGIGKTTTARILAKALNCEKGPTPAPCNKCASCKDITDGRNTDVIEIDGASNRGIDEIRNLRESVKFSPQNGKYKIYIIDEVHMLTPEAFNALLKTLEEPPAHVKFIFATTAAYKVIPTIVSRCQRFNFHRLSSEDIIKKLQKSAKDEKIKIEEPALFAIVRASSGSMRDAESLIDQLATYCENNITLKDVNKILGAVEQDRIHGFCQNIIDKNTASAIKQIGEMIEEGIDPNQFILSLIEYFRAAMILKEGKDLSQLLDLPKEEIERILKQTDKLTTEDILYIIYSLINTNSTMRRSPIPRIPLELLAVKLCQKESIVSISEIMKRLSYLEKESSRQTQVQQVRQVSGPEQSAKNSVEPPKPGIPSENDSQPDSYIESRPALYRIREAIPQVIKEIKQQKIYIASCLNEGRLVDFKDNLITMGFSKNNIFHKESLEKPQNKKLIEEHFSKILGARTAVEFIITKDGQPIGAGEKPQAEKEEADQKSPLKKALADPIIKTALDIFDGNIMKFM